MVTYYKQSCEESLEIFSALSQKDLFKKPKTPEGVEITIWKWFRAMIEHEVHHSGQLYLEC